MYSVLCKVTVTDRQNVSTDYSITVHSLYNIASDMKRNHNAVCIGMTSTERWTECGLHVMDCIDYYMADNASINVTYTLVEP